ncbi:hypothetical protein, partial [Mesorhizobium sp.]|uniref:hypothetical protein n=1 Tax=Mesorhizobium sp. TaxID=1871066 RepID=UPI0025B9A56C
EQLLDRGVEGVEIGMQDGGGIHGGHRALPFPSCGVAALAASFVRDVCRTKREQKRSTVKPPRQTVQTSTIRRNRKVCAVAVVISP